MRKIYETKAKGTIEYPVIGDIRQGEELKYKSSHNYYIWSACNVCGKLRWVATRKGRASYSKCSECAHKENIQRGINSPNWKNGRVKNEGYVEIKLQPDNFFFPMTGKNRYVLEHRLVMAKYLKRNLHSWEIVHHKNRIRDDNRIENLQLISDDRHKQISILESKIDRLLEGQKELKQEIRLLRLDNKLLRGKIESQKYL